jgi:acetyl esterase/lipase
MVPWFSTMESRPSPNLPQLIPLWPAGRTPLASAEDGELPRLTYYLPSDEFRTGQSILILPGGGYGMVSTPKEGHRPAQLFAAQGIAAAVLEYRHSPSRHPVPLLDAQRAMRRLRSLALTHGLRPDRVGVMGFSAGGHLAGTVATQPAHPDGLVGDELDPIGAHADFAALIYPVVSLVEPWSHFGSRDNLLGTPHDASLARRLSLENAVTPQTPPMFITHEQLDAVVPVANSLALYAALTAQRVPATLLVTEGDVHGAGLGANQPWGAALLAWLSGTR